MTTKIPVELSSTPGIVDGSNATAITIDSSENVGIGTASPLDALHISSAVSSEYRGNLLLDDSTTGFAAGVGGQITFGAEYRSNGDHTEWAAIQGAKANSTDANYAGTLKFKTRANGGALQANMVLDDTGNVGIGTSSPTAFTNYITVHHKNPSGDAIHLIESDGGIIGQTFVNDASGVVTTGARSNHPWRVTTNDAERMRIDSSGKVGIGTTSPSHNLDVISTSASTDVSARIASNSNSGDNDGTLIIGNGGTGDAMLRFDYEGTNTDRARIGVTASNQHLQFFTAGANERMRIDSSGSLLVGIQTINGNTASMHVDANTANKFCTTISHNGNTTNRFGLQIACGTDDNSGTNTMVSFLDGNFDGVGSITSSGGTVTYGAFTAHHEVNVPDSDNPSDESDAYPYGTLVEIVSTYLIDSNKRQSIRYTVQKSQSANSKKVLGAYASNMRPSPMCPRTGTYANNLHNISILGDGHVLCNNTGGNIEIGDGICTSAVEGIGMKATINPSMIVAIAQENVTFSGSETKLVAVQFGVQQFTPWS